MTPLIKTIRALAVEFIKRLYVPVVAITAIVGIALLSGSLWLTTLSDWWWILAILVIGILLLTTVLFVGTGLLMGVVAPTQTKDQRRQVKNLVDAMQHLAEVTATPRFFLFFQVVRDVVMPRENGFIASLTDDTSSIKEAFITLRNSFDA